MAIEERIKCPSCQRSVVPQLWVDNQEQLRQPRVFHLCPFCGTVLHESGGRPDYSWLVLGLGLGLFTAVLLFFLTWLQHRS